MSRFNTRGVIKCKDCKYYRKSVRCPKWRCDYPDNLGSNWLGTTYMKRPDDINWQNKCKWFKEKENDS